MFPFASLMFGANSGFAQAIASFSAGDTAATSGTLSALGAVAGDVVTAFPFVPSSPTGWSMFAAAGQTFAYRWILDADLSSGVTLKGMLSIYRGVGSLGLVSSDGVDGASSSSAPGFIKDPRHCGIVGLTSIMASRSPGVVNEFTTRAAYANNDNSGGFRLADRLYPANAIYIDNASLPWSTGSSVAGTGPQAAFVELRSA